MNNRRKRGKANINPHTGHPQYGAIWDGIKKIGKNLLNPYNPFNPFHGGISIGPFAEGGQPTRRSKKADGGKTARYLAAKMTMNPGAGAWGTVPSFFNPKFGKNE